MLYESLGFLVVAILAFLAGYAMSRGTGKSGYDDDISRAGVMVPKQMGDESVAPPQQNEMSMGGPGAMGVGSAPNFFDDRFNKSTGSPLGDDYPGWMCATALPGCQRAPSGCMVGCNPCSPLCSGEGNPCNVTAPVPSPVWQPQSASTVQYRLRTGNYVPAYCKQGSFALQKAPGCGNLGDIHSSTAPKQVTCYTAKHPV